jgi:hypothetical protein
MKPIGSNQWSRMPGLHRREDSFLRRMLTIEHQPVYPLIERKSCEEQAAVD